MEVDHEKKEFALESKFWPITVYLLYQRRILLPRKANKMSQYVKNLISAVSKFRNLITMTYWLRLILAAMNTMFRENKQNVI